MSVSRIIGLVKECVGPKEDPMDVSNMKQRECYDRQYLIDSTRVGFELVWYTTNTVTPKRLKEIQNRQPIRKAQKQLLQEAPGHFNHDFFHTDIYDFARYARQFDVDPDVRLVNLFVYGMALEQQYLQPNPNLPDGCTEYNTASSTLKKMIFIPIIQRQVPHIDIGSVGELPQRTNVTPILPPLNIYRDNPSVLCIYHP